MLQAYLLDLPLKLFSYGDKTFKYLAPWTTGRRQRWRHFTLLIGQTGAAGVSETAHYREPANAFF